MQDEDEAAEVEVDSDDDRTKMLSDPLDVTQHHCGFCGINVRIAVNAARLYTV